MENTIDNIERIDNYINNTLSETDRLAFEKQLQTDDTFNTFYTEHLVLLEGMKRTALKADILAAQKHYAFKRWIKLLGISISAIILAIVVYFSFFSTSTTEPSVNLPAQKTLTIDNTPEIENSVITDSTKKYILVYKRDSLVVDKLYAEATTLKEVELVSYLQYSSVEAIKIDFPEIKSLKAVNDTIRHYKKYTYEMLKTKIEAITEDSDKGDNEDRNVSETIEDTINTETVLKQNNIVKDSIITEVPEPLSPELIEFYKSVKKAPETITIDMEKGATIVLKEGTQLTISPKSLAYKKTNRIARGKIKLEVTEYYKLSDILLANLSTKSDANLLETGGMLFIKASKNGKELKLTDTKTLSISFPDKDKKGMQLFSGEQHQNEVNWKLQKPINTGTINFLEVIEEDIEVAFNVVEKVPTYPGCENSINNKTKRECLNKQINAFLRKNYNTEIAENLKLTGKNRVNIFFKINKNGRVINIDARAPHQKLAEEAIRVIRLLPKMEPALQRERPVRVPYYLPLDITLEGISKYSPPIRVSDESDIIGVINDKIALDSTSTHVTKNDLERYTFATSKLGWINCDRFAKMTGKRVRFRLKIKEAGNANLKLVFKSLSAVLPSKKYKNSFDFGTVPAGENVVLVAIKKIRDKIYLGIKETETKQISELDLDFKEVTIEELKGALKKYNNDF
jgi:hypothetical protein